MAYKEYIFKKDTIFTPVFAFHNPKELFIASYTQSVIHVWKAKHVSVVLDILKSSTFVLHSFEAPWNATVSRFPELLPC